jgi:acetyltransferase
MGDIRKMFNPGTIALIGASETEGTLGRAILENLLLSKDREVFAVNPARKHVLALECFPSITDIGKHIDLAVIATPASSVPAVVEACGKTKVEGLIIVSAGVKQTLEEWSLLKQRIRETGKDYGVRIIGPGSPGIILPNIDLNASVLKIHPMTGGTAFISQSRALGTAILDWGVSNHIGFSMFVGFGSMIDVDFSDVIDYLQDDYLTRNIMLYMEKVGNARRFISAARSFARNKPIVVLKPGRGTGKADVQDRIYDAVFRRVGLVRVKQTEDLFDTTQLLVSKSMPRGPRLAVVTNSSGVGVIAQDALMELEGKLAELSDETLEELGTILPRRWSRRNPVDILDDADVERYTKTVNACLRDPGVDGLLVAYIPLMGIPSEEVAKAIVELARQTWKPIIASWMGGSFARKGIEVLEENNIPVYETPEEAVNAYLYMYSYHRNIEFLNETPEELYLSQGRLTNYLKAIVRNAVKKGISLLPVEETLGFLKNYGISTVHTVVVRSRQEAAKMGKAVGYPVILKTAAHGTRQVKTRITGIVSDEAVKDAYDTLTGAFHDTFPDAPLPEVMLQGVLEDIESEWMLRTRKDPDFGSIILFERHLKEPKTRAGFSVGLPPLNQTLARGILEEANVDAFLPGSEEERAMPLRRLEELIMCVSNLITDFPEIAGMQIGPIALAGNTVFVLNAAITIEKDYKGDGSLYPHLVITPYPARYVIPWTLKDGTDVIIRPIRPEDEPLAREMLSTLSEETLRVRFFVVMEITHRMVMQFCNIDYDREMAFVAELKEGTQKKIIGGGRLIIEPDFKSGQFAVLIHDDYQRQGLGEKFLDITIGMAQERGLEEVYGLVLTENEKMLRVCRKMGFRSSLLPDGITRVSLSLN